MFPRVEMGPASTVPRPRPNSGRICGALLIGPPYTPGGCETPLTLKEATASGGPAKSSLIIEPLTRLRPAVLAMQWLLCNVSTPLPIFVREPGSGITPEKEVLRPFVPTLRFFNPTRIFTLNLYEPHVITPW